MLLTWVRLGVLCAASSLVCSSPITAQLIPLSLSLRSSVFPWLLACQRRLCHSRVDSEVSAERLLGLELPFSPQSLLGSPSGKGPAGSVESSGAKVVALLRSLTSQFPRLLLAPRAERYLSSSHSS